MNSTKEIIIDESSIQRLTGTSETFYTSLTLLDQQ